MGGPWPRMTQHASAREHGYWPRSMPILPAHSFPGERRQSATQQCSQRTTRGAASAPPNTLPAFIRARRLTSLTHSPPSPPTPQGRHRRRRGTERQRHAVSAAPLRVPWAHQVPSPRNSPSDPAPTLCCACAVLFPAYPSHDPQLTPFLTGTRPQARRAHANRLGQPRRPPPPAPAARGALLTPTPSHLESGGPALSRTWHPQPAQHGAQQRITRAGAETCSHPRALARRLASGPQVSPRWARTGWRRWTRARSSTACVRARPSVPSAPPCASLRCMPGIRREFTSRTSTLTLGVTESAAHFQRSLPRRSGAPRWHQPSAFPPPPALRPPPPPRGPESS